MVRKSEEWERGVEHPKSQDALLEVPTTSITENSKCHPCGWLGKAGPPPRASHALAPPGLTASLGGCGGVAPFLAPFYR